MTPTSRRIFLGSALAGAVGVRAWMHQWEQVRQYPPGPPVPYLPAEPVTAETSVFLTWRRDPTTTMTVQWLDADDPGNAAVQYRQGDSAAAPWHSQQAAVRPFAESSFQLFRVELAGLIPGSDYQFRLGPDSPPRTFRTMPARATDTIRFVSGGDCGTNQFTLANCVQAARHDPMFVVLGGDLGYDDGYSAHTSLTFVRLLSRQLFSANDRCIPVLACIGNHEVQGGFGRKRQQAPFFYALFDGLYPEVGFASLDFGDYLSLVLLDSNHTTPIEGEQADWLERTLRARADHPHVFVVQHVPSYPSFRSMEANQLSCGEDSRQHWVPLFEKHRVPVVLEHHDHTFKRSHPLLDNRVHKNGVTYLGDGSWGQLRAPRPPAQLPLLARTASAYQLALHQLEGDERRHQAVEHTGTIIDDCRTGQRLRGAVRVSLPRALA